MIEMWPRRERRTIVVTNCMSEERICVFYHRRNDEKTHLIVSRRKVYADGKSNCPRRDRKADFLSISDAHQYPYPDDLPPPGPDTAAAVPLRLF
jgi:hypothetical protein